MLFLTDPLPTKNPTSGSIPASAIAGGVVGATLALAALSAAMWFVLRRRRQKNAGIEFLPSEQPTVAEMAVPGDLYTHGQAKSDPALVVVEADSFAYVEADGESRYAELPAVRMDRRSHESDLDGGSAVRGDK